MYNGVLKGDDCMRLNITLADSLVKEVDEKAKAMYLSRSAYIAMALTEKLQKDKTMDNMPEMLRLFRDALEFEKKKKIDDSTVDD